jgi:hypothetical protein
MLQCTSPLMAHRVISLLGSNSVAFGAKRKSAELRCAYRTRFMSTRPNSLAGATNLERGRQILVNEINSISKRANERRQRAMMRPQRPCQLDFPIHASTSQ